MIITTKVKPETAGSMSGPCQFENQGMKKRLWRPRDEEIRDGIAVLQALAEIGYRWEDLPDDELGRVFWKLSTFVNDTRWLYIWVARESSRRHREKRKLEKGNVLDGKYLERSSI